MGCSAQFGGFVPSSSPRLTKTLPADVVFVADVSLDKVSRKAGLGNWGHAPPGPPASQRSWNIGAAGDPGIARRSREGCRATGSRGSGSVVLPTGLGNNQAPHYRAVCRE